MVHRDLKPENIFIDNDGTVTLLGFGLTKEITSSYAG
jgi:serine/threonine protein kinase